MRQKIKVTTAVLAGLFLMPIAARAEDNSAAAAPPEATSLDQVSLGVQWVGGKNTDLYGRYNGFTEQGIDILGGFEVQKRDAWDSGGTWHYDMSGINLDFQTGNTLRRDFHDNTYANNTNIDLGPEAELRLKLGDQGSWGITADYDAITYTGNLINSIYTVNGTTATLNNNFPAWGGATNTPSVGHPFGTPGAITSYTTATLSPAEMRFQTGTRRDIVQIGGNTIFDDWTLATNIRHEHKEGTMEQSLRETYGGEAFTMPVDYDTDRFDVSAAYNDPDTNMQALVQYTYSHFTDNNTAVTIPYPVSIAALSATSGPYAQSGLYSLPPSNSAHYLTAMFGDDIAPKTRITVNLRGGVELQNSTFPANSADPNLSSTLGHPTYAWFNHLNALNQGTSATSPEDAAWVYQGKLALNSKFDSDFDGQATYSFDGRSVHLNQFQVWGGGVSVDATANTALYVVPQDWFKQTADLQGTYHLWPEYNTKITADYTFKDVDRTNAQVEHSITNSGSLQLISMLGSDILGRLSYEHDNRTGSLIYGKPLNNLTAGVPTPFGTPSGVYYQAPMTSNSVIMRADYAPSQSEWNGGIYLKYAQENFHYPAIPSAAPAGDQTLGGYGNGIKQDYNLTVGPDVNYRPSVDINIHAYYTYEKIYYDNLGLGACADSNTGLCLGSAGYFKNSYDSAMNTAGMNGDWQFNSKLKFSAEYNMSRGLISFDQYNGVFVTSVTQSYQNVVPYPGIKSVMNQLRVSAAYQLTPRMEGSLLYQFSNFHNNDWDDLTPPVQPTTNTGTAISILTPGYAAPNYNVSTIGAVLKMSI